jgi:glycosyltransferase involved in cell wall biosynthesis
LRNQSDKKFSWIVADGGSSDGTLDLLASASDLNPYISSQPDFGIYDALNRAVKCAATDYYLVVGSDDWLAPDAIENFRSAAVEFNKPDLIAAAIMQGGRVVMPKEGLGWLYGMPGEASCHSFGILIKHSLHEKFGMYSRKFPITADQLFVKTILKNKGSIARCKFISGEFSLQGSSGGDDWGVITELFRVQVKTERWMLLQLILLFLRCAKCYAKIWMKDRFNG